MTSRDGPKHSVSRAVLKISFNSDNRPLLVKRGTNFIAAWDCHCWGSHDVNGHVIIIVAMVGYR